MEETVLFMIAVIMRKYVEACITNIVATGRFEGIREGNTSTLDNSSNFRR